MTYGAFVILKQTEFKKILKNTFKKYIKQTSNRPLSFISLSHSDNQSESATKFYNSFKADVGGNVLTLT